MGLSFPYHNFSGFQKVDGKILLGLYSLERGMLKGGLLEVYKTTSGIDRVPTSTIRK